MLWNRLPKGERKFDACPHKVVSFERVAYVGDADGQLKYTNEVREILKKKPKQKGIIITGFNAYLDCPVTDANEQELSSTIVHKGMPTEQDAYNNLRSVAGMTVCTSCVTCKLSPLQVVDQMTEIAEAKARALVAEANLKMLQDKVDKGEDIVQDLPPNGGVYKPAQVVDPNTKALEQ